MSDIEWMRAVMHFAMNVKHECPITSMLVINNKLISKASNESLQTHDPTMHSEIICIRKACMKLKRSNLSDSVLYCSHEPCPMCMEAIKLARIPKVIFGSFRTRDTSPTVDIIGGIFHDTSSKILSKFFANIRSLDKPGSN